MTKTERTPQPRHRRPLTGSLRRFLFGARPQPYRAPGDLPRITERLVDRDAALEQREAA